MVSKTISVKLLLFTFLLSVTIFLTTVEIFVRTYDFLFPKISWESQQGKWLVPNNIWGVWHEPNSRAMHRKKCFSAEYSSNSFGMRDKERDITSAKFRIAFLGASTLEGYSVNDKETITRILEDQIYNGKFEFLNFGTAGNFGTIQKLLIYQNLVRKFHPNIVVVFITAETELKNNNLEIQKEIAYLNYWKRPFLKKNEQGVWNIEYIDFGIPPKTSGEPVYQCSLSSLCFWNFLKSAIDELLDLGALSPHFQTPYSLYYQKSWMQTEVALGMLKSEVEKDGAKLIVVDVPNPIQLIPNYFNKLSTTSGYDPFSANKKLEKIAKKLELPYFFPFREFADYIKINGLKRPYLSHTCDSHWTAVGHKVAAESINKYLERFNMLPILH